MQERKHPENLPTPCAYRESLWQVEAMAEGVHSSGVTAPQTLLQPTLLLLQRKLGAGAGCHASLGFLFVEVRCFTSGYF